MNRYAVENLFGIQGFSIAWYGIIIAVGMLLGVTLAGYRAKKRGFSPDVVYDFAIITLPICIVFARIYYVVFEWEQYAENPIKIFAIREGGLAIYGGVLAGILCAIIFCKVKKFPFLQMADIAIPSLLLGQIIGRWGNFMNQEAFGNIVTDPKLQFFPYAVYIDRLSEWHQATFFYESLWNFILVILLLWLLTKVEKAGYALSIYLVGYGLGRYIIEGLRMDSLYILPGIRVSQMLSLILIVVGVLLFTYIKKSDQLEKYTGTYSLENAEHKIEDNNKIQKDDHTASM